MLSQAMLRNITKTRLKNYLQPKEIPNLNRRTHAHFVSDYSGILEVFREEIAIGKNSTKMMSITLSIMNFSMKTVTTTIFTSWTKLKLI
ncbi:hypothetical protein AAHB64_03395 [Bacillus toyonensis]